MSNQFEREVKLRYTDPVSARAAVIRLGAGTHRPRRLQQDALLDTADGLLRDQRSVLRVRSENGAAVLTFKGPVQPSTMKLREEIETTAGDPDVLLTLLQRLGFRVWFRYEKYREEFRKDDVIIAIDETPVGTFLEIEGSEQGVTDIAAELGHEPRDYVLDSYRGLFIRYCEERGATPGDMLFARG
jgi:adenylate cyclase, class 2